MAGWLNWPRKMVNEISDQKRHKLLSGKNKIHANKRLPINSYTVQQPLILSDKG